MNKSRPAALFSVFITITLLGFAAAGNSSACVPIDQNIAFCGILSHSHNVSSSLDVLGADTKALRFYNRLVKLLTSYDCSRPYGRYTCDECLDAYKHWVCAQSLPPCPEQKLCHQLCHDVARKCPYIVNFKCPPTDADDDQVCSAPARDAAWFESFHRA